ncbi:MAG: NUDIX hydrolase [Clostridia bacterium]
MIPFVPTAAPLQAQINAFIPSCPQEEFDRRLLLTYLRQFDNLLTRENALCHFTGSAWIINATHTRVLMIYHNIYQSWSWVGGHADGEADLLAVAMREAQEETGVTRITPLRSEPLSLEILPVDSHIKRGAFVSAHLHLNLTYLLQADDAEATKVKPDENSGVLWMTPSEAVSRSTEPCMQVIYQKLNGKLGLA